VKPAEQLKGFDALLARRWLRFDAVVVGGAALALLGVTERETRDCDVLDPDIPGEVLTAAQDFAAAQRAKGITLDDGWLNNGPVDLERALPDGWAERLRPAYSGTALHLQTLGRRDSLATKLFAMCDRETDADDCRRLAPTREEVDDLRSCLHDQGADDAWPAHVDQRLDRLLREIDSVRS
jgi:hypothetical protein